MAILVAGAAGTHSLAEADTDVRALTRAPDKAKLPAGVTVVQGEFSDVSSIRAAMNGVSTLLLLVANANSPRQC
ncbi:NAD(P)H-binding protein [Bradyrhizobium sp. USDA 4508]